MTQSTVGMFLEKPSQSRDFGHRSMKVEEKWRAVLERNRAYHSSFVYGVLSTGVYCRPTCPSRRPKMENIVFISSAGEAEKQGFRPCKRCRPQNRDIEPLHEGIVRNVCAYIDENYGTKITLRSLANVSGKSPFHLQRLFKKVMGITPAEYLKSKRLSNLKLSLRRGESVRRSAYIVGYNTTSWLYTGSNSKLGMKPSTYSNGGRDLEIRFLIAPSPLGLLLVACTNQGVCKVSLGDSERELISSLHQEFPNATKVAALEQAELLNWIKEIVEYLQGKHHIDNSRIPLDLKATAFQLRVWRKLQSIQYGSTKSYSQVAKSIDNPKAARAVARACASNPVALLIPCHRVILHTGSPGGYRWGWERKRQLLLMESRRNLRLPQSNARSET